MQVNRVYGLLGLAQRAGGLVSGDYRSETMLRRGEALMVLVAEDCGPATRERFSGLAQRHGVPICTFGTKDELGRAIGKSPRAVIVISQSKMAEAIADCLITGAASEIKRGSEVNEES